MKEFIGCILVITIVPVAAWFAADTITSWRQPGPRDGRTALDRATPPPPTPDPRAPIRQSKLPFPPPGPNPRDPRLKSKVKTVEQRLDRLEANAKEIDATIKRTQQHQAATLRKLDEIERIILELIERKEKEKPCLTSPSVAR